MINNRRRPPRRRGRRHTRRRNIRRRSRRNGTGKIIAVTGAILLTGGVLTAGAIWLVPKYLNFRAENTVVNESTEPADTNSTIQPVTAQTEPIPVATEPPVEIRLPENTAAIRFDLRETGLLHPIRDQGTYGSCFTFSFFCVMENRLLARGIDENLSEWAYYTSYREYTQFSDRQTDLAVIAGQRAVIVPERECFYPADNLRNYDASGYKLPESILDRRDYMINDYYVLSDGLTSSEEAAENVKSFVSRGYAVIGGFYSPGVDGTYTGSESSQDIMDYTTGAWYNYDPMLESNHSIAIIGWDDQYPKEKFLCQPKNDGAWLVQNSWGTAVGENGYFWLSYEDALMEKADFATFDAVPGDAYDTLYNQNFFTCYFTGDEYSTACSIQNAPSPYIATKYTAQESSPITAAGIYTMAENVNYKVYVTDTLENFDPSGSQSLASGRIAERGFHIVDFEWGYPVSKNEDFYVIIELQSDGTEYLIPMEARSLSFDHQDFQPGISFVSADGIHWDDTVESTEIVNSMDYYSDTYVCMTAYADT